MVERDRLAIEERKLQEGPLGLKEVWVEKTVVWARILSVSAQARAAYKQLVGDVTWEVRVKQRWLWRFGHFRLRWLTHPHNSNTRLIPVEPPLIDGRERYSVILCREELPSDVPL